MEDLDEMENRTGMPVTINSFDVSSFNIPGLRITMDRPMFVWGQRIGKALDLGCNDGSLTRYGNLLINQASGISDEDKFNHNNEWLTSFDLDMWQLPNFVRGDAHRLPFKTDSYDTVVMADMLEHTPDPIKILIEAARVARLLIIITLPNEPEWHDGMGSFGDANYSEEKQIANTLGHPSIYSKCTDYVPEKVLRHMPHLHSFDFYTIYELITKALGRKYKINIHNLYHDNPNKEEFRDTPYWGICIDLTTDISQMKYGITDIG